MNKVHIYICAESFALSRFENVGVWERLEVTVTEEQYAARDVGGLPLPTTKRRVLSSWGCLFLSKGDHTRALFPYAM